MLGANSGIAGFIAGLTIAVFSSKIKSLFPSLPERRVVLDVLLRESAIIILAITAFMRCFTEGLIIEVVYDYLAPRIGGIKLGFEQKNNC